MRLVVGVSVVCGVCYVWGLRRIGEEMRIGDSRAVAFVGLSDGCGRMDRDDGRLDRGRGARMRRLRRDEKEISCQLARGVRRKFTKQNRRKEKK